MQEPILKRIYFTDQDTITRHSLTDKCIVLDLDSTLISTQDNLKSLKRLRIMDDPAYLDLRSRIYVLNVEGLDKKGDGKVADLWGVVRPHVYEFLLFCFSYFRMVIVWSAGQRNYVRDVVEYLFTDLPKPNAVFTYDNIDFDDKGDILKDLTKLIELDDTIKKYANLKNTLALDDNISTFALNPDNGVLIPPYDPSMTISSLRTDDPSLLQFKSWLMEKDVIKDRDVRLLSKKDIFTRKV